MGLEKLVSIPVFITVSMIGTGRQLSVGIEGRAATKSGAIWFVAYDDGHTTPITRGENAGKTLTERNIVRDILRLGTWNSAPVAANFDIKNWPVKADNGGALLQGENQGAIYGSAMIKLH